MSNKSVFMGSAEQMKDKLGPALCLAKWKQVSLHLPTGLNNSCYHPPLHMIDPEAIETNPSALHNTWTHGHGNRLSYHDISKQKLLGSDLKGAE